MASQRNRHIDSDDSDDDPCNNNYWRRKSYPRGNAETKAKRGRPTKKAKNEVFDTLSHQLCPLCKMNRGTCFLRRCGHGMICPACSEKSIKKGRCPFCRSFVFSTVTYRCHE